MILYDAKLQHEKKHKIFDDIIVEKLAQNGFKNDKVSNDLLLSQFGAEWKDKCERSLLLAKHLGNIYCGSLYNGLVSLVCDDTIDLTNKQIMMFSYGSGCAASMYTIRCTSDYKAIQKVA